jgi:transglutaminase-like putative cysteine protease
MQPLVSAAAYVTAAIVGIRLIGIRRMLKWADRPIAARRADNWLAENGRYADLVLAVDRAGRHLPGGNCLARSLALTRMLRTRGVAAETKIGVKTANGFHAHAWVEVAGVPITPAAGRPLPSPAR